MNSVLVPVDIAANTGQIETNTAFIELTLRQMVVRQLNTSLLAAIVESVTVELVVWKLNAQ